MKNHIFLAVAVLILVPLGIVITMETLGENQSDLWNPTPPTLSREERSGQRREFMNFKNFDSTAMKFSIKMPEDWTAEQDGNSVYFLSNQPEGDSIRENINVLREEVSTSKTLDSYTAEAMQQVEDLKNYTLIGSQDITIDGLPARTIVYTAIIQDIPLQFQQAWTVKGDSAYLLTLATRSETFPEHATLFVRMVNSMDLK